MTTVYEVGNPDTAHGPHHHVTRYGLADRVSPEHFGMPVTVGEWPDGNGDRRHVRVPVARLVAAQPYVYRAHVENLATVPAHVLDTAHQHDPIEAILLPDQTVLVGHGHHRACAALLRGDETFLLTLETAR